MGTKIRSLKRATACILSLLIVLITICPVTVLAAEPEQKTVRVGYVNAATYEEGGEGEYKRGSGYEYLQKISYYTGWKYEYVYGSFKECYEKLVSGEIDLFGNVSYTPERAELFDFSSYPQGKDTFLLYTTREHTELTGGDIRQLGGCKIGVTDGSFQEGVLMEWLENNHIQAIILKFDGYETLMASLDAGELDAIATPDLSTSYDYLPIISIGFSDYYFAVSKDRPDLLTELNEALYEIQNSELDYNNQLVSRYHNELSNGLLLSERERTWLEEHDNTIRLGYLKDNLPYSDQDGNCELIGIMDTVVDTLEKEFGITIESTCFATISAIEQALRDDDIDICGPVYSDFYLAEQRDYVLTNAMVSTTPVVIYKGDNPDSCLDLIAVSDTSLFTADVVNVLFPEAQTVSFGSIEECLDAVESGKAGSTLGTSSRLNLLLAFQNAGELQFSEIAKKAEVCMATTKVNRAVASICSKGISLSSDVLNGTVLMQNAYAEHEMTAKEFVESHMTEVFAIVLLVVSLLVFLLYRAHISKKRLAAALTEAHSASVAKTTFLNNMSHDIRTPMNAIIGFTNIALKQQPGPQVQSCLEKIGESSEHLLTLINDVLDISRIESGKTKYEPIPTDITAVTDVVLDITNGFLINRDLKFTVNRAKLEKPYVLADAVRIREVLVNILSNAVKYTADGGSIKFETEYRFGVDDRHIVVRYRVTDTGVGMSEEFVKHVFDEFVQENNDARTQYKGTGLGMAITKRYVEMMGGTIAVESKKGVGSAFTVELPMELTDAKNVEKLEIPNLHTNLTGVKVLLAEDNELNAEIAQVQLEEYGMEVTLAADGEQVVRTFTDSPAGTFDVILMDIMMPKKNGYEATRAIRNLSNRPDGRSIPIIAMTANAFAEDVQASLDAGMNGHLSKPIMMDEVIKTIARNLD
ncbi:MAG: transporter substrate-binding domain-containing protein [Blautia sp.]|nr:transporter substrate-binding domain-containing protein [Blautia sp.]